MIEYLILHSQGSNFVRRLPERINSLKEEPYTGFDLIGSHQYGVLSPKSPGFEPAIRRPSAGIFTARLSGYKPIRNNHLLIRI